MPASAIARTRAYLEGICGVVEAQVWEKNGCLLSRVVVASDAGLTGADLQAACLSYLGEKLTPSLILVSQASRDSAAA